MLYFECWPLPSSHNYGHTKFGTTVDLSYVMPSAHFGCYRLKGGHSPFVLSLNVRLTFSDDFNVQQASALTYKYTAVTIRDIYILL